MRNVKDRDSVEVAEDGYGFFEADNAFGWRTNGLRFTCGGNRSPLMIGAEFDPQSQLALSSSIWLKADRYIFMMFLPRTEFIRRT
jgi:hypothetical protein